MGNISNAFDFNDSLAVFLASAISDGTYSDILTKLKFDEVGNEAVATQVDGAGGQLWSNVVDDYVKATYPSFYRATKTWRVADNTARDALGSDDGLAVNDIGYTEDTNSLWYVVSVDGAGASTWMSLGSAELAGGKGVPLNDLVAYVDLGDRGSYPGSGPTVSDFAGNLTAGTITGATYADGSLDFDGVSGDLTFTKPAAVDDIFAGGGTIMAFLRIRSDGEASIGEVVNTGFDGSGYKLAFDAEDTGDDGSVRVDFRREFTGNDGNWRTDDISTGVRAMPTNTWVSIAIVYDEDNVANDPIFYINGKQFLDFTTVLTPTGTPVSDVGNPLILGNRAADDRTFDGHYQGFVAWDRPATPATIANAHSAFLARRGQFIGTNAEGDVDAGGLLFQGGDYYGTNDDNGGIVRVLGGSTTSGNNSSHAGRVEIRGGNSDENGAGQLGAVIVVGGRGDQESTHTVGNLTVIGSEFGGGTLTLGNSAAGTLFRGSDNEATGPGGDAIFRGGDARDGSGNDGGGDAILISGRHRGGSTGGTLVMRTGGPSDGTGGVTGDLYLTTRQLAITGTPEGAQGNADTRTGFIEITTQCGVDATESGDIDIVAGSTSASSGNDPGALTLTSGSMLTTGQSSVGGRALTLNAGTSSGNAASPGGPIILNAGAQTNGGGSSDGGDIEGTAGATAASGRGGHVRFQAGTSASGNPGGIQLVAASVTPSEPVDAIELIGVITATYASSVIRIDATSDIELISGSGISGTTAGRPIDILSGDGFGARAGGVITVAVGDAGTTSDGAELELSAGNGGPTSGAGGNLNLTPGTRTSGDIGVVNILGGWANDLAVTPSAMGSTEDDFDPGGTYPECNALRLAGAGGGTTLSGIVADDVHNGQRMLVINVGNENIFLANDTTSAVANRFLMNAAYTLLPEQMCELWYDRTATRWRVMQSP